jgi:hypothetical protein
MADITIRPQIKSLLAIMTHPAGLRLSPVNHFDRLVHLFRRKGTGVTFRTIETHGVNVRIMAESNFPHPFYRVFNVTSPNPSRPNRGKNQNPQY